MCDIWFHQTELRWNGILRMYIWKSGIRKSRNEFKSKEIVVY